MLAIRSVFGPGSRRACGVLPALWPWHGAARRRTHLRGGRDVAQPAHARCPDRKVPGVTSTAPRHGGRAAANPLVLPRLRCTTRPGDGVRPMRPVHPRPAVPLGGVAPARGRVGRPAEPHQPPEPVARSHFFIWAVPQGGLMRPLRTRAVSLPLRSLASLCALDVFVFSSLGRPSVLSVPSVVNPIRPQPSTPPPAARGAPPAAPARTRAAPWSSPPGPGSGCGPSPSNRRSAPTAPAPRSPAACRGSAPG